MERLKNIGLVPINKDILFSLYGELKRPDEKVSELERKGLVIRVKRNLYVVAPKVHNQTISTELVANHLYRPSYVSLESALAYYGLIPERVFTMRSVCTKLHKQYDTPLGHFEYVKVPAPYFPIGIRQEIVGNSPIKREQNGLPILPSVRTISEGNSYAFLIASPEKALCDKIVTTPNLRLQSVKAMQEYLEDDLRIDFSAVEKFDLEIIRQCIEVEKKKGELELLLTFLETKIQIITMGKYKNDLLALTTNNFEKELLIASIDNLLDKNNKLRFNDFACGIRELSRHILSSLSPDERLKECCWYHNNGKSTRADKVKYAIQKGLPDDFVETFYDITEPIEEIKEILETLNKYTHVNSDTFNIAGKEINKLSVEVLECFKKIAQGIKEFHNLLKKQVEENIDSIILKKTIFETFGEIDILATYHEIEEHSISEYRISTIDSKNIFIKVNGDLSVRLQYGSDGDLARDDGFEMYTSFPFDCSIEILINKNFSESEYKVKNFNVDTDDWYK
jgi:hypothetical protein